jgi:histone deacetylase 11
MFNRSIYPADPDARRRIDCPVPLPHGCGEGQYLSALRSALPPFLDALTRAGRVGLAVYNAGTDVYEHDLLGGMRVSAAGVLERDRFVLDQLTGRGLPAVMVLSGGYSRESYRLVAETVASLFTEPG